MPTPASSQAPKHPFDIECNKDWLSRCSTPIEAAMIAPFSGQLLTDDLAIHLGQSTNDCGRRIKLAESYTSSIGRARADYITKSLSIDLAAVSAERDRWKNAAEEKTPFFEKPVVVMFLTAGTMTALFFVTTTAIKATSKILPVP